MSEFNLKEVSLAVDGLPVTGWADGDVINFEYREDAASLTMGADGEGVLNTLNDRSAEITITLLYGTAANARLQELVDSTVSIYCRDTNGGFEGYAEECRVMKRPSRTFGNEAGSVEWKFVTPKLESSHGQQA